MSSATTQTAVLVLLQHRTVTLSIDSNTAALTHLILRLRLHRSTRDGYVFKGWKAVAPPIRQRVTLTTTPKVVLVAEWEPEPVAPILENPVTPEDPGTQASQAAWSLTPSIQELQILQLSRIMELCGYTLVMKNHSLSYVIMSRSGVITLAIVAFAQRAVRQTP